jgi:hypothetical protein
MKEKQRTDVDTSDLLIESRLAWIAPYMKVRRQISQLMKSVIME